MMQRLNWGGKGGGHCANRALYVFLHRDKG